METPPPGQVVSPQNSSNEPERQDPQQQTPIQPESQDIQQPDSPAIEPAALAQYPQPELSQQPQPTEVSDENVISWTASEYIAHHKSASWFMSLSLAGAALAVATYFLTGGDIVSIIVVVFVVVVFGFYGARKPREQQYSISPDGITIGPKTYQFGQFKSFAIIDEDAFSSITFMPMQRFMPAISIYYDPQDEDAIVEILSAYLPMETRGHDPVERFMRKIRF